MGTYVYRHVCRYVYRHVNRHEHRPVDRHVDRQVYRHVYEFDQACDQTCDQAHAQTYMRHISLCTDMHMGTKGRPQQVCAHTVGMGLVDGGCIWTHTALLPENVESVIATSSLYSRLAQPVQA